VAPEVAVAGVGKNSYGHPSREAVERYLAAGTLFLRTDLDGIVSIVCDGTGIKSIKRFNGPENRLAWQNGR
jgi:beta-lactamase superfamily II metal-dependent hydrolase